MAGKWATSTLNGLASAGELKGLKDRWVEEDDEGAAKKKVIGKSPKASTHKKDAIKTESAADLEKAWAEFRKEKAAFEAEKKEWYATREEGSKASPIGTTASQTSTSSNALKITNCPHCDSYLAVSWKEEHHCYNCDKDI
eukprot:TRINITY_DN1765_c0_g1_i1.p1 TRINITY_DN1765_c0_g1~~TRINITY_DN1765_c0_g1_i1.p1  ORF type:complete len:140 (-),score=39.89 TRINITY_DN1765_c0_g1_i1:46-465(-)